MKLHQCPAAAADPVALCFLDAFAPIQLIERIQEALRVGGDAHAPLRHPFAFHRVAAAFAHTVLHLVVGEHGAQRGTPVHPGLAAVGQAEVLQHGLLFARVEGLPFRGGEGRRLHVLVAREAAAVDAGEAVVLEAADEAADWLGALHLDVVPAVEELQEDPLRPAVVGGVAGAHLAAPIKAEADAVQLFAVAGDVDLGGLRRVLAGLDGVLLRGQPEAVVTHGVQHVEAAVPLEARHDVAGDVAERVPHVEACAAGVREHVEHVVLGLGGVILHAVGPQVPPPFAPLLLDLFVLVGHVRC